VALEAGGGSFASVKRIEESTVSGTDVEDRTLRRDAVQASGKLRPGVPQEPVGRPGEAPARGPVPACVGSVVDAPQLAQRVRPVSRCASSPNVAPHHSQRSALAAAVGASVRPPGTGGAGVFGIAER
jgi:hypothetical protein